MRDKEESGVKLYCKAKLIDLKRYIKSWFIEKFP
jgi:hypothetical protein